MTGAGKTHTMLGDIYDSGQGEKGVCFITVDRLFNLIEERTSEELRFDVKVSYLEIYNEQVWDLLVEKPQHLMIVEDQAKGVFVPDLKEVDVNHPSEMLNLIIIGNKRRWMAATGSNQFSSRSHAILQIGVEATWLVDGVVKDVSSSKISLIDLAGSEWAAISSNTGQRMVEGANINRSLLALGNCINILSDKNKTGTFVPYRDSKLTRLLKDSLGGSTKTMMIACISPSYLCYEETINTLKYSHRAWSIKKKAKRNIKEPDGKIS